MDYNTRRAIIRRIKKWWDFKSSYEKMIKKSKFKKVTYREFLSVRNQYLKRKVLNWYKWCNVCGCHHPYTYEVFWYNGFNADWTRRLHSVCLKARWQIKKNIIIMKDKRYKSMLKSQRKNREKNWHKWHRPKISEMTEAEKIIQREKWRKYGAIRYNKLKNEKN